MNTKQRIEKRVMDLLGGDEANGFAINHFSNKLMLDAIATAVGEELDDKASSRHSHLSNARFG